MQFINYAISAFNLINFENLDILTEHKRNIKHEKLENEIRMVLTFTGDTSP